MKRELDEITREKARRANEKAAASTGENPEQKSTGFKVGDKVIYRGSEGTIVSVEDVNGKNKYGIDTGKGVKYVMGEGTIKAVEAEKPVEKPVEKAETYIITDEEAKGVDKEERDKAQKELNVIHERTNGYILSNIESAIKDLENGMKRTASMFRRIIYGKKIALLKEELAKREAYAKEHGIKNGKMTIDETEALFNHFNGDAEIADIAKKVFAVARIFKPTIKMTRELKGGSDGNCGVTDGIVKYNYGRYCTESVGSQHKANVIVHELIHSATNYALHAYDLHKRGFDEGWNKLTEGQQKAVEELVNIYEKIKYSSASEFPDVEGNGKNGKAYGLFNSHEMLAEMATPSFRASLKAKKLWTSFKNAIKQFFGIETPNAKETTAFAEIDKALDYLLDNPNEEVYKFYRGKGGRNRSDIGKIEDNIDNPVENFKNDNEVLKVFNELDEKGINDVTLPEINKVIDGIQDGRITFERYNKKEQEGLGRGGRTLIGSAIIAARAGRSKEGGRDGQKLAWYDLDPIQIRDVENYAKANGIWIEDTDAELEKHFGKHENGGNESRVYFGIRKAYKNKAQTYTTLQKALDAVVIHNALFPKASLKLIGFGKDWDGEFRMVLEQPRFKILERPVTKKDLNDFVKKLGFVHDDYYNADGPNFKNAEHILEDLHSGNIVWVEDKSAPNGMRLECIDNKLRLNLAELGHGGERTTTYSFIGERGATEEESKALDIAEKMEIEGKDELSIKIATGWERGADGKWRYEQPDGELKEQFKDGLPRESKLGEIWNDKELFNAYPQLYDIDVYSSKMEESKGGHYDSDEFAIAINKDLKGDKLRSILTHEIQHAIQHIEGFETGTNPDSSKAKEYASKKTENDPDIEEYRQTYRDVQEGLDDATKFINKYIKGRPIVEGSIERMPEYKELSDYAKQYVEYCLGGEYLDEYSNWDSFAKQESKNIQELIYDADEEYRQEYYHNKGGEVESRNVQKRMDMTPEERRHTLALDTEDVPRDKQIIGADDNGGVSASVTTVNGTDYPNEPRKPIKIAGEYDKEVRKTKNRLKESVQDSMMSLKAVQDLITKAGGNIQDWANAYLAENRLSSVTRAELDKVNRTIVRPMHDAISKITQKGVDVETISNYVMGKHGIERNREMNLIGI